MRRIPHRISLASALCTVATASLSAWAQSAPPNSGQPVVVSTGQRITPLAPTGARFEPLNPGLLDNPEYTVGQAVTTVLSPDGKTLLVLTSGYNLLNYTSGTNVGNQNNADSIEWIFVFDVSTKTPVQLQAIAVPNTYSGVAWSPDGQNFYVSGGDDDNVHFYGRATGKWAESQAPLALGHLALADAKTSSAGGLGLAVKPEAAGLAVSPDGSRILVTNYENDSVTVLTRPRGYWDKGGELDLRPGKAQFAPASGVAGGEYPYWIQFKTNDIAYVSSIRDREVDLVSFLGVLARIKVPGQPNRMVMNKAKTLLYVAQDNADSIAVIDTNTNQVVDEIPVTAPPAQYANKNNYFGANPNSLALSPDEKTLYVTNGGENAVAVVNLNGPGGSSVAGLIPTGFYPNSVSVSADGTQLYIVNGKSDTGPNPQYCRGLTAAAAAACQASNQYDLQLNKAGFQTVPVPAAAELSSLTTRVLQNDHFGSTMTPAQQETMAFLHQHIKHVIYIIKENRTYDQILGDLEVGNGDPAQNEFGEADTPNFHNLARNFVDFDNFYDVSNVSFDGWSWSTSARTTDVTEKEVTVNYAGRGVSYDTEGQNRNIDVGIQGTAARLKAQPLQSADPDLLPGPGNVGAPDNDDDGGQGQGYLWSGALKQGLSVRNYGFLLDLIRYNQSLPKGVAIPEDPNAFADKVQVAIPVSPQLISLTDLYYRGFDNAMPDYFRFTEWNREFQQYEAAGNLPNLTLLRIMHDHFGNFSNALNGVNTPELQMADNDYAVASVIETVSKSKDAGSTLVFVIEDDSQDGGDHVNAHRSTAFVVGPYVKQGFVDGTRYNTVNMLKTMEEVLGIAPLNLNDANALPMANAFDTAQATWSFKATPSGYLKNTTLPIPATAYAETSAAQLRPLHTAQWWALHTRGMDFSVEDHLPTARFNRVVWQGVMGAEKPYSTRRSGADLSVNRAQFLKSFYAQQQQAKAERGTGLPVASAAHGSR